MSIPPYGAGRRDLTSLDEQRAAAPETTARWCGVHRPHPEHVWKSLDDEPFRCAPETTPGQAAYEAFRTPGKSGWDLISDTDREFWETAAQAAVRATPLYAELAKQLAMLRADLADAEAQLAKWPRCPDGCGCRLGAEDADAAECACDGPCCMECRENGYPDAPSYRDIAAQERPAPELAAQLAEERALRLRLAGERDEARSDYSRLRAALLEGGQSHAAVRKRCLAIIATAGTLPAAVQERPAPGLPYDPTADDLAIASLTDEVTRLRDEIHCTASELEASAVLTAPSKKSEIQFELVRKLQKILEGK